MAGGVFSLAKLFGITIRESANDGSDFTNPDADYRRLFLGEDGRLHLRDSAGAVTGASGGTSLILDSLLASDINGTALTAATWTDVLANQNFTVAEAASLVEFAISGFAFSNVNGSQIGTRIVIDSAGTPINIILSGAYMSAATQGNFFNGIGPVYKAGLSAAVHTIKVQAYSSATGTFYCRPSASPPLEFLRVQVIEHLN